MLYPTRFPFIIVIAMLFNSPSRGDFVINAGDHVLQANTANQTIPIFAFFTSSAAHSVTSTGGLQFNVRLGDGAGVAGSAPVFQGASVPAAGTQTGIQFAGTIWDGLAAVDIVGTAPVDLGNGVVAGQFGSMGISFITNSNFRVLSAGPQLVAKLVIDTTGVSSGTFAITLDGAELGKTYFQSATDVNLAGNTFVNNGRFIVSVPEPSTLALICCATLTGMAIRRRNAKSHL